MASIRDITFVISDLSDVSEITPFVAWFAFGSRELPYKVLGIFFLISGSTKIYTLITAVMHIHNLPAYHVLAFLEIIFVYSFYRLLSTKKLDFVGISGLFVLYLANTGIQNINNTFNSNTWTLTVLLIMLIGLTHFYRIYRNEEDTTPLEKRPDFIMTTGWLIYASGSLFTYLMGTDILSGTADGFFKNAWIFECISNIIKNILICYGFWLTGKKCHRQYT